MSRDRIADTYFEWICAIVYGENVQKTACKTYRRLLSYLHNTPFRYSVLNDGNRAEDGLDLRYRFAWEHGYKDIEEDFLANPCSVLEMIAALAIRCEEHIMDDPDIGDRTGKWFWDMIWNLGLGRMTDERFDKVLTEEKISVFLDREYEENGEGGLFTIKNHRVDMRRAEIWYQMLWYLDSILQTGYEERRTDMR